MTTKTSILIFYLTLSKTHKVFRWATIATMVVVNVGGLALALLNVFQCDPVSAAFHIPVKPPAYCINIVTIYLSSAPLNIITDLAIFFLPMPILTGMHLPRKQKMILVITFGFGIFVAAVDVVRIFYLQSAQRDDLRAKQQNIDRDGSVIPLRREAKDTRAHIYTIGPIRATNLTFHGMRPSHPCGAPSKSTRALCAHACRL